MRPPLPPAAPISRRTMLRRAGLGFGSWAMLDLLARDEGRRRRQTPLTAKPAARPGRAKHVIFLFMQGGPSHLDTFDPKPLLNRMHGQPLPASAAQGLRLQFTKSDAALLGSPQTFRNAASPASKSRIATPISRPCADDLAVVRSCYHESFNHAPAEYMLSTGSARMGRPCLGSWVTYGLGSESENLPAFVVMAMSASGQGRPAGVRAWLPAGHVPADDAAE